MNIRSFSTLALVLGASAAFVVGCGKKEESGTTEAGNAPANATAATPTVTVTTRPTTTTTTTATVKPVVSALPSATASAPATATTTAPPAASSVPGLRLPMIKPKKN